MSYLRFGLVVFNGMIFGFIAVAAFRNFRREVSNRTRSLWILVALTSLALVIGSIQRALVQASLLGWLDPTIADLAASNWQVAQSLAVSAIAVGGFVGVRKLAASLSATERVAGSLLDRVSHVDVSGLELSPRESEILGLIGSGLLTDAELSEVLHISRSTVQTHVKSLLRKTGLNSRKDLVAVANLRG